MSLIDDAIQSLSAFPDAQEAVRQLVSEHDALKSEHGILSLKYDHANNKNEVLDRQLADIREIVKELEKEEPEHILPSTEHVELERTELTVILQSSLSAGLDETIPKKVHTESEG